MVTIQVMMIEALIPQVIGMACQQGARVTSCYRSHVIRVMLRQKTLVRQIV